jgi:hypothetical protein
VPGVKALTWEVDRADGAASSLGGLQVAAAP